MRIPVAALDKPITVASHSESHKKWYDRTITFSSKDLKKIGDVSTGGNGNSGSTDNGTTGGNGSTNGSNNTTGNTTTKVDTKPDTESKYESDTSGSTKAVNSKTKLKDGVYKPDKFSWSGGSGRVNITCDKVTIKNGQHWYNCIQQFCLSVCKSKRQKISANPYRRKIHFCHSGGTEQEQQYHRYDYQDEYGA